MIELGMKIRWKVQRDDGTVLARYDSKAKAMAAAVRFSADGCAYSVIEEPSNLIDQLTDKGQLLRLRSQSRRS
jgi:hypothetical protein